MADDTDPWDWTLDQVVEAFCVKREIWARERPNAKLPDAVKLEATLREQEVDGATLLTDVTPEVLKQDFEIKALGQLSSIKWGIEQLRKKSRKYLEQNPQPAYFGNQSVHGSFYASTPIPYTPYPPYQPQQRPEVYSPPPTDRQLFPRREGSVEGGASPIFARPSLPEHNLQARIQSPPVGLTSPLRDASSRDGAAKRRAGETVIEDNTGRKKRRLDLSGAATAVAATSKPIEQIVPSSAASNASYATAETSASDQSGKQVVELPRLDLRAQLSGLGSKHSSYLGSKKFALEDLFFGSAKFGQGLNPNINMVPLSEDGPLSKDVFVFASPANLSLHGRQHFVNRRMISFLRRRRNLQVKGTEDGVAFYPYSGSLLKNESLARSYMNFEVRNGEAIALRKRDLKPGEEAVEEDVASAVSNHDWDFLAHWQKGDHTELPEYGQSDSEDDSELDSLEKEIEADQAEDREAAKAVLTVEDAAKVIDDAIANQVQEWQEKSLPVFKDKKALSIWKNAGMTKVRRRLADLARDKVAELNAYINKMKARMLEDRWESKSTLRRQCESLEETVKRREEEKWRISVWQLSQPPPSPSGNLKTRRKGDTRVSKNFAEHMVDSDEEIIDDREDLGDFFDIDELVPVDLTHVSDLDDHDAEQLIDNNDNIDDLPVATADADDMDIDGDSEKNSDEQHEHDTEVDSVLGGRRRSKDATDTIQENAIKEEPAPRVSFAEPRRLQVPTEVVDLTFDSDDDEPPGPKASTASQTSRSTNQGPRFSDEPENDSDEAIEEWSWDDLEEREDRFRIIIKLLRTMPQFAYKRLRDFVLADNDNDDDKYYSGIYPLADDARRILRKKLGQPQQSFELAEFAYERTTEMLHLWICWLENSGQYFRGYDNDEASFDLEALNSKVLKAANKQADADGGVDMLHCFSLVERVLRKHEFAIGAGVDPDSDMQGLNADEGSQLTPHKRRKRVVLESQSAVSKRSKNKRNAEAWGDRTKMFLSQQPAQSSELAARTGGGIVVNTGKEDDDEAIYINHHVADQMKQHQIDGVRFTWREIVGLFDDTEETQGCLLAHTMGLGKTLQMIAFITTLAMAAKSDEPSIRRQIPKKLRNLRILILCPPGLVSNWVEEFTKWNEQRSAIGKPYTITAQTLKQNRLPLLEDWYERANGSVLILGYSMFRTWALNSAPKDKDPPFTEDEHKDVKKMLLQGPNLVIADEAHTLKNHKSKITQAARLLKTRSRVALTGSPLSNNLLEYFAMVDWIAPGYLGELVEFKANYVEPIEEGLYLGSSPYERRRARIKLAALISILEPKIDRKEIDVLEGVLKSKVQFVLKVPLTSLQTKIYEAFVAAAQDHMGKDVPNTRLWALMAWLQMICSHPALFEAEARNVRAKLEATKKKRAKSPVKRVAQLQEEGARPTSEGDETDHSEEPKDDAEEDGSAPEDPLALQIAEQVAKELAEELRPVVAAATDAELSHKTNLLLQIVTMSRAAKDKLLIFSHRLPTLDYLGKILKDAGVRCERLDGATQMSKRQQMTKDFNEGNKFDAFLISTRAGGVGFNLYGANRVVLFDFSFNPTWEEQAIGRAFRLGQQKPVYVYRFISPGTFEDALFNQTVFKTQLAYQVVEKKNTRSKAVRMRDYIKMPQESELQDLSGAVGNDKLLEGIIAGMEKDNELIHDLKLDTVFKEELKETLDEESRKEMETLVQNQKLRISNPEAYRQLQEVERGYAPASTARAASFNPVPNHLMDGMPPPRSTAPARGVTLPSARSVGSALNIPPSARFAPSLGDLPHGLPTTTPSTHGLPYPKPTGFSLGNSGGNARPPS